MELTLVAVLLGSVLAGAPGGVPLEKITDSTMLPPGVSGTFIIDSRPVSCLGNVFFNALEDGALIGLYAATPQGLAVIANRTIPVPGTMLTFQNATRTDCGGDRLVFLGAGDRSSLTPQAGIYTFQNGAISPPLLETDMPLSDSDIQSFSSLDATELGIVADVSLFPATDKQVVVMRPFGGAPTIIADRSTVLPGQTQPLSILSRPILAGSDVFFHARTDFDVGIYRWRNGEGITIVADVDTPVPLSGQGNFGAFGIFTNLNGRVVFGATFAGGLGLFAFQGGDLEPVVLPGDLTAEGATLVSAFEPRGAGNLLTFLGRTQDAPFLDAVFVKEGDGPVRRLLGVGDTFEGRDVHTVASNADHRDVLVWAGNLDPPFTAIYRVRFGAAATDIPALSWWGILALALGLGLVGWQALRRL
jgi:hypothetical protein